MIQYFRNIRHYISENFSAEQERLILWIPVLFGCGIGIYFLLPSEPNLWLSLIIFESVLAAFYLLRFHNLHLLFISVLLVLCGFIDIQLQTLYKSRRISVSEDKTTYLQGRISDISFSAKGKPRLLLDNVADFDKPLAGKFRVTVSPRDNPQIGECVEMVATLFKSAPIQIKDGFQLDRKYFYGGISSIGYAASELFTIDCPPEATQSLFRLRLNRVRSAISADIFKILPADEAGVADAVLIGEKSRLNSDIVTQYRNSGLAHFLSVSGLHLGSVAGLVFFLIRFLTALFPAVALRYDNKRIAAPAAVLFSGLYLLISGMEIPAVRAFIMTVVVLIGIMFNRQAVSMRMVAFAALVILLISPQALISISFQMSFAAVTALVAFYERYRNLATYRHKNIFGKILYYLIGIVLCDFVASLATTPFALYHFHKIATYTSLGNLLAGPLIGLIIMPLILLCLAAIPCGFLRYPLTLLGLALGFLNKITAFVAALPHSVITINSLPFYGFLLIVFGGCWLCLWLQPWRKLGFILIIIGILPAFFTKQPDMVFSRHAQQIALRDNSGKLQMLPLTSDRWLQSIWEENLFLQKQSKTEKKRLAKVLAGGVDGKLSLSCADNVCTYKDIVSFTAEGQIFINQTPINTAGGGYIYVKDNKAAFQPLHSGTNNRLWQQGN